MIDLKYKELMLSYLEHLDRVTGIDWTNKECFISCSKDGTVRLYDLSSPYSYTSLNMNTGVCVRSSPFNGNQFGFGTTKESFLFMIHVINSKDTPNY